MRRWSFLPLRAIAPWWWVPAAVVLVAVDYATGPFFQFPSVYVLVVAGAAWFSGLATGLALALIMPFSRVALMLTIWDEPWDAQTFIATGVTRLVVFSTMAVLVARLADHERAMVKQVDALTSLLPMCAYCQRIRGADDRWTTLDQYSGRATFQFATGLCPDCAASHLPPEYAPVIEGGPVRHSDASREGGTGGRQRSA